MSILFIQTATPHSSIRAQEGLDALLMGSAFSECSVLFLGSAVQQLRSNQSPEAIGRKDFAKGFGALKDYGVNNVYCLDSDMDAHGISSSELLLDVKRVSASEIRTLIDQHDKVLTF